MQFGRRDIMERYVPTPSQRRDKPEPLDHVEKLLQRLAIQ